MGLSQRLKLRMRRFLQRPGTTVDLAPLEKHLPRIEAREGELRELTDEELTAAAADSRTQIIEAHRLSTVDDSDHIEELDGGRVDAEGPH